MGNESNIACGPLLDGVAGPPPMYSTTVRYVLSCFLVLFPVTALAGNVLVILTVILTRSLHTMSYAFVVSLAVADSLVAVLVMPFQIYVQFNNKAWQLDADFCVWTICFDVMFSCSSILHVSCLGLDRYLAICRPFLHQRMSKKIVSMMLTVCWTTPVTLSFIPILTGWIHIGIEDFIACAYPPEIQACALVVNKAYTVIGSWVSFYIPVMLLTFGYLKIYQTARRHTRQIQAQEMSAAAREDRKAFRKETNAAKTIGVVTGCFCICWFPFIILFSTEAFIGYSIPYNLWGVAAWLGYINSMCNPFLYYWFNKPFRTSFQRVITCTCRSRVEITGTSGSNE
jgi:hypothetical protein